MPRQPRIDLPQVAQHIVQRGNDRQPCFFTDGDRLRYLGDLRELAIQTGCAVHAYVLMTNHVHLLVTPAESGQIPRLMQALGRRYVRYVNTRYRRTGTLWEGRYKACLVHGEAYVLRCYRYIENNPVRATMVAHPESYPWSSHAHNALGRADPLIHPHPIYTALGATSEARQRAYKALVAETLTDDDTAAIRDHLQQQHPLGSERFRAAIEATLKRRVGPGRPGRPPRTSSTQDI